MKKKIIGILVITLLITTTLPVIGTINVDKSKPSEEIILKENEKSDDILSLLINRAFMFTWLDSDWDYTPRGNAPGLLHPYTDSIIVFGANAPGTFTTAPESRIQADAAGGARILGTQGNTADKPAIGFFSSNGVDDGGGGNGIFRPLANTMAFATSSNERMRISNNGNIGIGTTDPLSLLHVVGGQIEIDEDGQNSRWQIHGSAFGFGIKDEDQNEYRLIIKNDNGKIGISTFSPTSRLHIGGPVATAITSVVAPPLPGYDITEDDSVIFAEATSSSIPGFVILPYTGLSPGREYKIKNIGDTGIVWVVASLGDNDLIDDVPEHSLNPLDSIIVVSDGDPTGTGGHWFIMAEYDH
jgi:hypothetical protein